jgi:hypothetical protein
VAATDSKSSSSASTSSRTARWSLTSGANRPGARTESASRPFSPSRTDLRRVVYTQSGVIRAVAGVSTRVDRVVAPRLAWEPHWAACRFGAAMVVRPGVLGIAHESWDAALVLACLLDRGSTRPVASSLGTASKSEERRT